jgi:glycogen debranching enzyme
VNEVDVTRSTVIKDGNAFGVCRPDGELPAGEHSLGVFVDDCRHLCRHELRINGVAPRLLVSSDQAGSAAVYELTNPDVPLDGRDLLPLQALRVRVEQRIRCDGLDEIIELHSHHHEPVELDIALRLDADFTPMLELRGMLERVDRPVVRTGAGATLRLSAVGLDGWTRATTISCEGAEATDDGLLARVRIAPRSAHRLALTYGFSATPPSDEPPAAPALNRHPAAREAVADAHAWLAGRARLETADDLVDRIVRRSMLDLRLLISDLDGHPYVAAGVPWYATLFGRDSLICAHQMLAFDPALAAGTLRLLARHQGRRVDDRHDEQPGKILHELRLGEVANLDRSPLARYYGTVDATPLFLGLLCRYVDWTGSLSLFTELRPHVDAALTWLERHGDLDGDGLIEYARRAPGGLDNQGWKDSWDGICDEHGRLLSGPIALIEAQAYAARAWLDVGRILERLGEDARGAELRVRAERVLVGLESFWLADRGAYAMALDGDKRPSRALASNQGHLLWSEVVGRDRAQAIRDRLMDASLSSGWGIRTLSADEVSFNPVGYHTGTVWPHDTALIAAGLRSYGFDEDFIALCEGLLEAAAAFPEFRLPELFAGFSRQEYEAPVPYPVACRPQAWAAGAVPYLLVTALGIRPDALNRVLRIRRPLLPRMLDSVWLRGLRVAGATVDLRFERVRAGDPAAAVTEAQVDGDVDVVVDLTGQPPSSPMAAAARQAPQEAQTPAEAPHAAATYRS